MNTNRRSSAQKSARAGNRDQTKFDKWLIVRQQGVQLVDFVLDPSPYSVETLDVVTARVVEVDRYFICVELVAEDQCWWIPKDSIKGAADHLPNKQEEPVQ